MRGNLLPVCIVCAKTPVLGIMDGVVLKGKFLCTECEKSILSLEVTSTEYDDIVEKLKNLWN